MGDHTGDEYLYSDLFDGEIRVLYLLPGNHDDDICFSLRHQHLSKYEPVQPSSRRMQEVLSTLPAGWKASRTPEGRYFHCDPWNVGETLTYVDESSVNVTSPAPESAGHSNYEDDEAFEALSYAWGNLERDQIVHVISPEIGSAASYSTILRVTQNLKEALRYLRRSDQVRRIWIDVICINQEDIDERTAQVLRMREIFSQALRVIAWLGPPTSSSASAMQTLAYLGQQVEVSSDGFRYGSINATEPLWYMGKQPLPYSDDTWHSLSELFCRPFFARLWILQELFLASRNSYLQTGDCVVSWYDFRRAVVALDQKIGIPDRFTLAYNVKGLRDVAYGATATTIRDIMYSAHQHGCSDPRDRVYAVHAFLGPRMASTLQPSYTASFESVYQNAFLTYCKVSNRLDMLAECILQTDIGTLPSWVPDWQTPEGTVNMPGPGYFASGLSKAIFRLGDNDEVLKVVGVQVDVIDHIIRPTRIGEHDEFTSRLSEIMAESADEMSYVNGGSVRDAWLKTIIQGRVKERLPTCYIQTFQEWADTVKHYVASGQLLSEDDIFAADSMNVSRSLLSIVKCFQTKTGYVGYGHLYIEPGDVVCVLLGLFVPVILRPMNGLYQVVGWSYVHGLMEAEALLGPLPADWKMEHYKINSRYRARFRELSTGTLHDDDPRLESLSDEWQRLSSDSLELTSDDPARVEHFKRMSTGEVVNYDPRITPEMLESRGVKLESFRLR